MNEPGNLTDKAKIGFLPETEIQEIRRYRVILSSPGGQQEYPCDDVLIRTGYESDLSLTAAITGRAGRRLFGVHIRLMNLLKKRVLYDQSGNPYAG